MAKAKTDIRSLARSHTESAVKCLVGIMNQPKAQASARVQAANALLDRGWGKAAQPVTGGDGEGPVEIVRRIVREDADN
jgi:hypothetical protein